MSKNKTITKQQYLEATGLLFLAKKHAVKTQEYEHALGSILEPEIESGHSLDAVWEPYDVDALLNKIGIVVEDSNE